jgi:hypothetical protein
MAQKIDDLKFLLGQGARPNKYRISIDSPAMGDGDFLDALCQATSIPAKTIGTIPVYNKGRKILIAGDVTFDNTWDVTFYNDEAHTIRTLVDTWMTQIDDFESGAHAADASEYMFEASVTQLDGAENEAGSWTFYNLYPTSISAVDVGDETADTISTFTVTFTYSHWVRIA